MRKQLLPVVMSVVLLGAFPAIAGGGGAPKKDEHGGPDIPTLKMPRLVAPVMVKGEMVRYVHLDVTLVLLREDDKKRVYDKVPYIQDAFLRDVHATTVLKSEETEELDRAGLRARLLAIVARVAGTSAVKDVEFRDITQDAAAGSPAGG
jgi:hypothetical protein